MVDAATRLPMKTGESPRMRHAAATAWLPFTSLRHEVDRLFEDFDRGFRRLPFRGPLIDVEPLWRTEPGWSDAPAVDIVEKDNAYEVTAELPGFDEKNIEVKLVDGSLMISGEKREEKDARKTDYWLHERHFGSFERRFAMPESVDAAKIEAGFKKGVLTVTLPKRPEAQKPEKRIAIKTV